METISDSTVCSRGTAEKSVEARFIVFDYFLRIMAVGIAVILALAFILLMTPVISIASMTTMIAMSAIPSIVIMIPLPPRVEIVVASAPLMIV